MGSGRIYQFSEKIQNSPRKKMRPVKICILGNFWDSQIYSGELCLFSDNGDLHRIHWRAAIDELAHRNISVQTALRVAFLDGDLFYNPKVRKILLDPQLTTPIKHQLSELSSIDLQKDLRDWSAHRSVDSSPFDFLPTDTEIYYNTMFAAGDEGLFSSPRSVTGRYGHRGTAARHHDGKIMQVKASDRYTALATATGDDGLLEFPLDPKDKQGNSVGRHKLLARRPCAACDWAFQSVMGWTTESAFFASFKEEKAPHGSGLIRLADKVFDISEVFKSPSQQGRSISWGARDKVYRLTPSGGIEIADYNPNVNRAVNKSKKSQDMFDVRDLMERSIDDRDLIERSVDFDDVVSTGTAPFGTVIEFSNKLVVIRSDDVVDTFDGELVHWRIFPRSEHYSNQLHLLYEDRVEIVSFIHDYFVDQQSKLYGFSKRAGIL
jgi:hypothetical protein